MTQFKVGDHVILHYIDPDPFYEDLKCIVTSICISGHYKYLVKLTHPSIARRAGGSQYSAGFEFPCLDKEVSYVLLSRRIVLK